MALQIIVGAQWGDEGKGRIVDWFAAQADYVARYNGGDNAGHTVTVGGQIYKLHLIPSGIIHPETIAVLGNGMVINPKTLLGEMEMLRSVGIEISPKRLRISAFAHLITPAHRALDSAFERARGSASLGTTGRGIGPAYTDRAARRGLRLGDLLAPDFSARLERHLDEANRTLAFLGAPTLEPGAILSEYLSYAQVLKDYITDVSLELNLALQSGKSVLAEGAQGTLLDIDFGTYPYVTSSHTIAAGALTGLGLGLHAVASACTLGVVKAFQTRVGAGPFPTEIGGELAERLRGSGANPWDEYGTTTGRPRRVGWLDGVLLRYAACINGFHEIAVTKLDILTGIHPIRLCVAYEEDNRRLENLPLGPLNLERYRPIYEDLPGWDEPVSHCRRWTDLPPAARNYVERIATLCGVPVRFVSVGAEREQMVICEARE
ncbi:MAG: adenylosuccinate synthase [Anaerolineales bacterium]|nr:adenylosuccinate synthase [Anaerolineales bacterium]MCX7608634.1 adenylosuccinate synthase [Anaerolineales bacterium]MDW8228136.1 adenylosuccinate synthase [Anaerolineales bacterium]